MPVKITIERTVKPDQQEELRFLLKELRAQAIQQPGYISGETLTSVDKSGTHLVISTWHSLQDWRAWENNPQRKKIASQVEPLLTSPSKVSVFMEQWASLPEGI
jgi:quinol monooxygenase YgiN